MVSEKISLSGNEFTGYAWSRVSICSALDIMLRWRGNKRYMMKSVFETHNRGSIVHLKVKSNNYKNLKIS